MLPSAPKHSYFMIICESLQLMWQKKGFSTIINGMSTYGFIGLGLIGGSIAKALKKAHTDTYIVACEPDAEALRMAAEEGIVDRGFTSLLENTSSPGDASSPGNASSPENTSSPGTASLPGDASPALTALAACNVIFLCAPVLKNSENLRILRRMYPVGDIAKEKNSAFSTALKEPAACPLLTDVGSVKTEIHRQITALGLTPYFVGGHPMAGSEKSGYAYARASLLENVYYILTPEAAVPESRVSSFHDLIASLGAIPLTMSYDAHDRAVAGVSHFPHIVAAALVHLVKAADKDAGVMHAIAAGGFRDITRIASSSPEMWQHICLTNTENIVALLDDYAANLQAVKEALRAGDADALYAFFNEAKGYRDSFGNAASSPLGVLHFLYTNIDDTPGTLGRVATLLGDAGVSIRNVGIVHNREFENGVLRIDFYENAAKKRAKEILRAAGYVVYTM